MIRRRLESLAGRFLATLVAGMARLRRVDKPMHPRGVVFEGTLTRHGSPRRTGASFLDDEGQHEVVVRLSRSVGLPEPWPDVSGLALRIPDADAGYADLLFSGTGRGRLTRYLLRPSSTLRGGFFGTLAPHRAPCGPVQLGAHETGERRWELYWAQPREGWAPFAVLELAVHPSPERDISFDAVRAAPVGLSVYGWHRRLRGPSYAAARRSRGASLDASPPGS